jgi:hypothetical protein
MSRAAPHMSEADYRLSSANSVSNQGVKSACNKIKRIARKHTIALRVRP